MLFLGIQYGVVVGIVLTQMIGFTLMSFGPKVWFYNLATAIKEDPNLHRMYRWVNIAHFTLVGVLFADAVYRLVKLEHSQEKIPLQQMVPASNMAMQTDEFQAQRNFVLCGVSLFLSFAIYQYLHLLFRVVELEEDVSGAVKKPWSSDSSLRTAPASQRTKLS